MSSKNGSMDMWLKFDEMGCPDIKNRLGATIIVVLLITIIIYLITVWAVQAIFQSPGRKYSYWAIFFILLAASIISSIISAGIFALVAKAGVPMA